MDSSDLEKHQAEKLHEQVTSMLGYLKRLRERMTHQGFPVEDKLLTAATRAEDAVHQLFVETHRLTCGQGLKSSQGELISHEDIDSLL